MSDGHVGVKIVSGIIDTVDVCVVVNELRIYLLKLLHGEL
jgi:hypothetical protein